MSRVGNGYAREANKPKSTFLSNVIGREDEDEYMKEADRGGLDFVYTFGSTLNV